MGDPLITFGERLQLAICQAKKRREEIALHIEELDRREQQWCAARAEALAALEEARVAAQKITLRQKHLEDVTRVVSARAPDDQRVSQITEQIEILSQRAGLSDSATGLIADLCELIREKKK